MAFCDLKNEIGKPHSSLCEIQSSGHHCLGLLACGSQEKTDQAGQSGDPVPTQHVLLTYNRAKGGELY